MQKLYSNAANSEPRIISKAVAGGRHIARGGSARAAVRRCRVHQTLRVTPAMEAGLADHVWSLEELLGFLDPSNLAFGLTDLFRRVLKVKGFQKPAYQQVWSEARFFRRGPARPARLALANRRNNDTIPAGWGDQIQYAILSRVLA